MPTHSFQSQRANIRPKSDIIDGGKPVCVLVGRRAREMAAKDKVEQHQTKFCFDCYTLFVEVI